MSNEQSTTKSNSSEIGSFVDLSEGFLVGGGRYSLTQSLGQGGMGVVWLAKDERLGQMVALKFVQLQSNPMVLDDLRRETARSLKLTHPNIIRIFDFYEAPGDVAFISMEYVDGENLHSLRAQQPNQVFSWNYLKPLIKQLCEALEYAHGENVIHRDLKPGNMMVDRKGRLKLADFGIASAVSDPLQAYYQRHAASGTLTHMSPQQMAGKPSTIADDIYALGATLYDLLTGTPPFHGDDIPEQVQNNLAEPISIRLAKLKIPNEVPPHVAAMIMACLSKEPSLRPQTASAVAEWIGFDNPGPVRSGPIVIGTGADKPSEHKTKSIAIPSPVLPQPIVQAPPTPEVQIPEPRKWPVRKMAIWSGTALVALLILGTIGWLFGKLMFENAPVVSTIPDGSAELDAGFRHGEVAIDNFVRDVQVQANGHIVLGGAFKMVNGEESSGIAVLKPDGTLDENFVAGVDGLVHCVACYRDGRIILGGEFTNVNGQVGKSIARLMPDGTVDPTFPLRTDTEGSPRAILIQPDGKILVVGQFTRFHGNARNRITRLNADGNIDSTFNADANAVIWSAALQSDGKVIVGGNFTTINGTKRNRVARLNRDGEIDSGFEPGSGANGLVYAVALQEDEKILIGGNFTEYNGRPRNRVARLDANGKLDPTFAPGAGPDSGIRALGLQNDGKILIGGVFKYFNDTSLQHIARLHKNGSLDLTFRPGEGFDDTVRALAVQENGMIVVVGHFTHYSGKATTRIVRLQGSKGVR